MTALSISRKSPYRSEQGFDRRDETCTATDDANGINQYSSITHNETPFVPIFDADGNQTLVQSSTGIWTVVYNAENRPISFTKTEADQTSTIECGYDYMGRRSTKKVTVDGAITLHQRYIYRGYLQIACVDLLRGGHPALWYTLWDPSEPIATRPLAIQKNGTWYTYGHDLTKNVTELYNADGTIATSYDYTPFGAVTATGTEQAFQWSCEFYDAELGMVYYNYRHYNPLDGRWIGRDFLEEEGGGDNLYGFVRNIALSSFDILGMVSTLPQAAGLGITAGAATKVGRAAAKAARAAKKVDNKKKPNKKTQKGCKPCVPPAGSMRHEIAKPGSRKRGAHSCDPVGHVKVWTMNQSPPPSCKCNWGKPETFENTQTPPSGSAENGPPPRNPAPGGGPE